MNIKSLLLGSAAALLAVSGARAADAVVVVAEPEPMEYVRICDVYGTGYYYIPGTETCIKISGLVRYRIDYDNADYLAVSATWGPDGPDAGGFPDLTLAFPDVAGDQGWRKSARARLNVQTKTETELGTLGINIRIQADRASGGGFNGHAWRTNYFFGIPFGAFGPTSSSPSSAVNVKHAYITLGGFWVGLAPSLFDGDLSGEYDTAGFGDEIHSLGYSFDNGSGLTAAVALEEAGFNSDWIPNVVGKVTWTGGMVGVKVFGAYDSAAEEGSLKGIIDIKPTDRITLSAIGIWESGSNKYSANPYEGHVNKALSFLTFATPLLIPASAITVPGNGGYEWSLGGQVAFQATDKLNVVVGGQYFADSHAVGNDAYTIGASAAYTIVPNLTATLAVNYNKIEDLPPIIDDEFWSGFAAIEAAF